MNRMDMDESGFVVLLIIVYRSRHPAATASKQRHTCAHITQADSATPDLTNIQIPTVKRQDSRCRSRGGASAMYHERKQILVTIQALGLHDTIHDPRTAIEKLSSQNKPVLVTQYSQGASPRGVRLFMQVVRILEVRKGACLTKDVKTSTRKRKGAFTCPCPTNLPCGCRK